MRFAVIFGALSNQRVKPKIPLYVTYLYPTILAVYIVLGAFFVELQSEKTNAYEKRLQNL